MKVSVGQQWVELQKENDQWVVPGFENLKLEQVSESLMRVYSKSKIYTIDILQSKNEEGNTELLLNGQMVEAKLSSNLDELLQKMGLDSALEVKVKELTSPMPGLVIKTLVNAGDTVKKGEPLVVLEAMKMENVLKSPADARVEKVNVSAGQAVEKGAILIQFD